MKKGSVTKKGSVQGPRTLLLVQHLGNRSNRYENMQSIPQHELNIISISSQYQVLCTLCFNEDSVNHACLRHNNTVWGTCEAKKKRKNTHKKTNNTYKNPNPKNPNQHKQHLWCVWVWVFCVDFVFFVVCLFVFLFWVLFFCFFAMTTPSGAPVKRIQRISHTQGPIGKINHVPFLG